MSAKSALTIAELNYQKANVDVTIQQYLAACASEQAVLESVEQFVGFVMSTDIGLFCFLSFVTPMSYYSLASSQSSAHAGA